MSVCRRKGIHRLAFRHRITRELISQFFQSEFQSGRQLTGIGDRFRQVSKEIAHLFRAANMALRILRKQPACGIEPPLVLDAGEYVGNLAFGWSCIANAVRRQQRKTTLPRQADSGLVSRFLKTVGVSLQFHVHILRAKDGDELSKQVAATGRFHLLPKH